MPIIINHNLCDEALECGGIEVCPTKAFYFDTKTKRVKVNRKKCTECLKCTLPDACPVGCILYARNKDEEERILKMIKLDPRTSKWLWKERYGCQPAKTPPKAKIITDANYKKVMSEEEYKIIDVWHYDHLDCRVFSALYEDLVGMSKIKIYKLDAKRYPEVAKKLRVKKFPTLLLCKDYQEIFRHEGLMKKKEIKDNSTRITKLVKRKK